MGLEKMPEKKNSERSSGTGWELDEHTVTELCANKSAKCPRCETETLRGGPQGPVSAALCNPELWLSSCPFGWLLDILGLYMPLTPSAAGERLLLLVISKTGLVSALDLTADGCA